MYLTLLHQSQLLLLQLLSPAIIFVADDAVALATTSISSYILLLLMLPLPLLLLISPAICVAADAFAGAVVAFEANSAIICVVAVDATATFALAVVATAAT
jgi:hypothetical protein